ncbi:conjugal transfer protein TraI [Sphingobacterium yanglingense]|uniref:Conjugal transfer protein TraI n=1 Tax=Sphingobacterium yanglingense TaxID=1437280 RepID=A0A4R6W9E1_9SPHI|nr:conjugal transfer protein TraI [Sphingobacterium yanglingense]TDQ73809.1 hypothetical protein CLV99_4246 [Sphingobacterium yanglingense]
MRKLRNYFMIFFLGISLVSLPTLTANAGIYEIIKAAVVKAIRAADLAIQRQQNRVIWLQNAQKVLENTLSKLKLDEISDWTGRQKEQYQKYFDELRKVKMLISYYQRIKDISEKQLLLTKEYSRVWTTIRNDTYFTPEEIDYMSKVYIGILEQSLNNVNELSMIVNNFRTQMSDAKRLEIINSVSDKVDENYSDLKQFNAQNSILRLQRAKTNNEIQLVKRMYGLE